MLSKFHKNAVLNGYIDSYCLVCESHLRSEQDTNIHIGDANHVKNLESTHYLEKYKDNRIRKVKNGYYCEFCNLLLYTAAKVGLHILEDRHINHKGAQLLKRHGNDISAFDDVLINEAAWNGLIDETCAVCNKEFEDKSIHVTESTHILNLVQSKVVFGADKSIYRKIDDGSFQCLTCNMVLSLSSITAHFQEREHKEIYDKCNTAYITHKVALTQHSHTENVPIDDAQEDTFKPPEDPKPITTQVTEESEPIATQKIPEKSTQDNVAKKQEAKSNETGKKTDTIQNGKKQETAKNTSTQEVKKENATEAKKAQKPKLEKVTEDLDAEICKALNARDFVTPDDEGKHWCLLCDWTMDSAVIENHVNGKHHKKMLKMHRERIENKKKLQDDSSQSEIKVESEKNSKAEQEEKATILDSVSRFQKNDININFETCTAMCKKCSKNVDFVYQSIEAHIEEHKNNAKKQTVKPAPVSNEKPNSVSGGNAKPTVVSNANAERSKKDTVKPSITVDKQGSVSGSNAKETPAGIAKREESKSPSNNDDDKEARATPSSFTQEENEEIERIVKEHDLTYDKESKRVHCKVCKTRIPSSVHNMQQHVNGSSHKNKMKASDKKASTVMKKPMKDFIKQLVGVENPIAKDVVLNEKIVVSVFSFSMITVRGQMRCQVCEVSFQIDQLESHSRSSRHERAMAETPVIISFESEFIREVRPNIYHCGFCNIVESKTEMPLHLSSTAHRDAKTACNWRLQQYLPEIRMQQRREEIGMYVRMLSEVLDL